MPWLLLALVAAATTATREILVKRAMRDSDALTVATLINGVVFLILASPAAFAGVPPLDTVFWRALAVSATINAAAALLIARAVHESDLSLVAPLQSLTPVFMLLTALLILGELPRAAGAAGVALIAAGAYLLGASRRAVVDGVRPLAALLGDSGARKMLLVALLFSVSAAVDKVGVLHSTPLLWGTAVNGAVAAALAPFALVRRRKASRAGAARPAETAAVTRLLLAAGVISALGVAAQMAALPMVYASYVIAVKRISILLSVIAGRVFFGERGLRNRLAAALLMLAGLALLALT